MNTITADADLIHDLDLILSNKEELHTRMTAACLESVRNDDAATNDPAAYRAAYNWGNSDWRTFIDCAGLAVRDAVLDLIEDEVKEGFVYDLITQRLDLGNTAVWARVAESFMPDPDDVTCSECERSDDCQCEIGLV